MGRKDWCVHYAGLHERTHCRADVAYADVMRPLNEADRAAYEARVAKNERMWGSVVKMPPYNGQYNMMDRLPCFRENGLTTCSQLRFRTPEEIKEDERRLHEAVERIGTVRAAIVKAIKDSGNWKKSVSGAIECPVCKTGRVGFSYAGSYNGHIHAKCSTQGCVSWME